MRVLKINTKASEVDGLIHVTSMQVLKEGNNIVEDPWDTVMNVLRIKEAYGAISGTGDLILDIGCLDINTLG